MSLYFYLTRVNNVPLLPTSFPQGERIKMLGTTFSIYLPASEKRVEKPARSAEQTIEGKGTILLVDDEEMVLDVSVQLLKALGYTVLEAKGGREAVEIYRENKDRIDMVLLDMIMGFFYI